MYKILMEDEYYKQSMENQYRLNPNIKDVVRTKVFKLLDALIIYPIFTTIGQVQFT